MNSEKFDHLLNFVKEKITKENARLRKNIGWRKVKKHSPRGVSSVKKVFLKISQNSLENTCSRVCFLTKLQVSGTGVFLWILQNLFSCRTPPVAAPAGWWQQLLSFAFRIAKSIVGKILAETCQAIYVSLKSTYLQALPNDFQNLFQNSLKTHEIFHMWLE